VSDRKRPATWRAAFGISLLCTAGLGGLVGVNLLILAKFVPTFETMFIEMGAALPTPTVLALELSRNLRVFPYLWLPLLGMGLGANALVLLVLARLRTWIWALLLGAIQAALLLLMPLLITASLYLPIFAMADLVE